jgi:hypothetical protein
MAATEEVRAMLDAEVHEALDAMTHTHKRSKAELIRAAVDFFLQEEFRKAHAGKLLLQMLGEKGTALEKRWKSPP